MEGSTGRGARGSAGLTGWLEAEDFAAASLGLEVERALEGGSMGSDSVVAAAEGQEAVACEGT